MSEATLHARLVPQTVHGIPVPGSYSGGVTEHGDLTGRDADDQHPISAITNLAETIEEQSDKITDITIQLLAETKKLASFAQLQNLLPISTNNPVLQDALIGCEIPDTWVAENADGTDGAEYDDPMIVVALENIEDANGTAHWGAYVQRKWMALRKIQFDAAETDIADGYNNYKLSAVRQYLNSDDGVGEWWTKAHDDDMPPTLLATTRGYMAGCSAALLAAAKLCKVSYKPSDGDADTITNTFFLPSATQLYGVGNDGEGVFWPYWKRATGLTTPNNSSNAGRCFYPIDNHTSSDTCRTRSAYSNNNNRTYIVSAEGAISTGRPSTGYGFTPCCAIW